MMRRSHLAILLVTGSLALAFAGLAPERAEAAPRYTVNAEILCIWGGFAWSDTLGCANKTCTFEGKVYQPGEHVTIVNGKYQYYCDGWTGQMQRLIVSAPTSSLPKLTYY